MCHSLRRRVTSTHNNIVRRIHSGQRTIDFSRLCGNGSHPETELTNDVEHRCTRQFRRLTLGSGPKSNKKVTKLYPQSSSNCNGWYCPDRTLNERVCLRKHHGAESLPISISSWRLRGASTRGMLPDSKKGEIVTHTNNSWTL